MRRIDVKAELQDEIVTREHGRKLSRLVEDALADAPVVIDFDGLQITSVSFFDEAFGQLALARGDDLRSVIRLENIDPFDLALVTDIIMSRARQAKQTKKPSPQRPHG